MVIIEPDTDNLFHRLPDWLMAYDVALAKRIHRALLVDGSAFGDDLTDRKMFGGLGYMINGNMAAAAASQGGLMLRVDPARSAELVQRPGARRFEMRGREMNGWLLIDAGAVAQDDDLQEWIALGAAYARSLPPK